MTDETAMTRIRQAAEAINKRLPASCAQDGLEALCADIFQSVSEHHRGASWPDVSLFARMAEECGASASKALPKPAGVRDSLAINFDRLRAGEALGDEWFYGRRAVELLGKGATERDLDAYRSSLFFNMKDVWGDEMARDHELRLRRKHDDALEADARPRYFETQRFNAEEREKAGL